MQYTLREFQLSFSECLEQVPVLSSFSKIYFHQVTILPHRLYKWPGTAYRRSRHTWRLEKKLCYPSDYINNIPLGTNDYNLLGTRKLDENLYVKIVPTRKQKTDSTAYIRSIQTCCLKMIWVPPFVLCTKFHPLQRPGTLDVGVSLGGSLYG